MKISGHNPPPRETLFYKSQVRAHESIIPHNTTNGAEQIQSSNEQIAETRNRFGGRELEFGARMELGA